MFKMNFVGFAIFQNIPMSHTLWIKTSWSVTVGNHLLYPYFQRWLNLLILSPWIPLGTFLIFAWLRTVTSFAYASGNICFSSCDVLRFIRSHTSTQLIRTVCNITNMQVSCLLYIAGILAIVIDILSQEIDSKLVVSSWKRFILINILQS